MKRLIGTLRVAVEEPLGWIIAVRQRQAIRVLLGRDPLPMGEVEKGPSHNSQGQHKEPDLPPAPTLESLMMSRNTGGRKAVRSADYTWDQHECNILENLSSV